MTIQVKTLPSANAFFIEGADTILEAGLRGGLALNYGCSNGICGLCKSRVVSGEVEKTRHHDYSLTETEKSLGYILSCSYTALTDVVLEADEADSVDDIPEQQIPIRIRKIDRPNQEVVIVSVKTPRTRRLRFLAGQQVKLSVEDIGEGYYSIASCPCDDMNLQFHVPNRSDDAVAIYLNSNARVHDRMILKGPIGCFTLNEKSPNSLVFIAQSSGFAPVKGLIEHAMSLDSAENIHLYWIASGKDGHYLDNLCRSWNDALDNFFYCRVFDDGSSHWMPALISELGANHRDLQALDYYLCTEQGVTAQIEMFLKSCSVPDNQLNTETYEHCLQQVDQ